MLGRDSVTINSGGEKIFAEEVEQAVAGHPDVHDAVVCGRPSERWGHEVVALVRPLPVPRVEPPIELAETKRRSRGTSSRRRCGSCHASSGARRQGRLPVGQTAGPRPRRRRGPFRSPRADARPQRRRTTMSYTIGIDVGGTFTDIVVSDGQVVARKAPTDPQEFGHGVLQACELVAAQVGRTRAELFPDVDRFGLGTTAVTNVLTVKKGMKVGLLTTARFEDTVAAARESAGGVRRLARGCLAAGRALVHIRAVKERIGRRRRCRRSVGRSAGDWSRSTVW